MFTIAINKDDKNKWIELKADMPLEEEALGDYYIFTVAADNLDEAVGEAQRMRETVHNVGKGVIK